MKIPVAFICDSHYVIPTAVAITSLICNKNPDTYYDIYLIAADLSEMEIEKFYEFRGNKADIHIIKASLEKFHGIQQNSYVTYATYLKFYLPELIPHLDKVLYLDSDVIIQKDLSDLFEININDYYAGAVKDIPQIENYLHITHYFNSGLMLLNLNLMREHHAAEALFNIRKSRNDLKFVDQDCFNILFEGKVKLLPIIYNCFYNLFLRCGDKYTIDYINKCCGTNYPSLNDLKKDSYIIHLAGCDKPWIYFNSVFVREWDEYFKKSPLKHHKLRRKSIKILDFVESHKKLLEFIESHNMINTLYHLFLVMHEHGFKFTIDRVKDHFNNKN